MTESYEDYLVPTNDRHIYSVGLGFNWEAWTLDLAYSYIDPVPRSYNTNPSLGVLRGRADGESHIVSMSLGYAF
jgi:long-chain fatty acid transport protein